LSKVILGKSGGRNVALDLNILLRTRLLVQSGSGGGKSWLLRRLAEQLFGKVQVIIIDPEGEFASLREKFDFVLVGKGGETPADVRSAEMVAHKLLELRASAVCDLYEMKPSERHRWVRLFLEAVIDAPKKLWHPLILIVDEAHVYCPEKGAGESEASEAMIALSTRGRKRGYCPVPATQRLSKLRKDLAAEHQNVMIGKTTLAMDRDRAADEIGVEKKRGTRDEFSNSLRRLKPGQFFATGPAISDDRILIAVGGVKTTHPQAGHYKQATKPPAPPSKIKALLPKLADLPKEAEEKARTEVEFRKEIRSLRAQLRSQSVKVVPKEVQVADPRAVRAAVQKVEAQRGKELQQRDRAIQQMSSALASVAKLAAKAAGIQVPKIAAVALPQAAPVQHSPSRIPPQEPQLTKPNGKEKLRSGAERMLGALVQWHPNGMTLGQMRAHAGLKKSGTVSAYLSDLRRGQFMEERDGMLFSTQIGLDYFEHLPQAPTTTQEVLDIWRPKLRDGARRMLEVLVEQAGEQMSREELGEKANLVKSGTFSAYLSDLKTARLAVVTPSGIAADRETLFL